MHLLSLLSVVTLAVASPLSVEDYAKALDERGKYSLSTNNMSCTYKASSYHCLYYQLQQL